MGILGRRLSTRAGLKGLTQGMFCNATGIYRFHFHRAALQAEPSPRCKGGRRRKARDSRQRAGGIERENPDPCQDPEKCCRGQGHHGLLFTGDLPVPFPQQTRCEAQLPPRACRAFVRSPASEMVRGGGHRQCGRSRTDPVPCSGLAEGPAPSRPPWPSRSSLMELVGSSVPDAWHHPAVLYPGTRGALGGLAHPEGPAPGRCGEGSSRPGPVLPPPRPLAPGEPAPAAPERTGLAKAPALGWHRLLRINPAAYRGLKLRGRPRPPLAPRGIKGIPRGGTAGPGRCCRGIVLNGHFVPSAPAPPRLPAHPTTHPTPPVRRPRRPHPAGLEPAAPAGRGGGRGGGGKWPLGGGRCCAGDGRALPGGNFGVAERRSDGRRRVPGRAGLLRGPMAQHILALAAEEAPERLQEALQSLGEDEVRGRPVRGAGLGEGPLTGSPSRCSWAMW